MRGDDPGSYSWRFGRWLPVNVRSVARDGTHYAYKTQYGEIHEVEIASGNDRSLSLVVPEGAVSGVLYYAPEGIYFASAGRGVPDRLWLVDPRTGKLELILTGKYVDAVGGYAAWLADVNNPADLPPHTALPDQIVRRDLNGGPTVPWFYRAGHVLSVLGFDQDKHPLVAVDYEEVWQVPAANQGRKLFSGTQFVKVMTDSHGIWFADDHGIWLYTQASGLHRVSPVVGVLGGSCGPPQPRSSRS